MKKNLLLVALAFMLATVMTGCNNTSDSTTPAAPMTNAPASTNT